MRKNYDLRGIKHREAYSFKQIVQMLGVHLRTVQNWQSEGLKTLSAEKPFLVMGYDLKEFLQKKIQSRKTKLKENEFYCINCRKAVKAKDNNVHLASLNKTIGKQRLKAFIIKGICQECGSVLNRFSHEGKLAEEKNIFNIANIGEYTNE